MKKLTAGIFTVMLGLCATSGAEAAVASKGYVDSFVGKDGSITSAVSTLSQTVADNKTAAETAIADAKKAGTDAAAALETYKGTNDAAVQAAQAAADKAQGEVDALETAVGTLPEGSDSVVAYINKKTEGIATDAALGELQTKVNTNTGAIETLSGTGEGSVSKAVADAVAGMSAEGGAVKENADAIAALEDLVGETSVESQIAAATDDMATNASVAEDIAAEFTKANLSQYATTSAMETALTSYELKSNLKALAYKDTVGTDDIDDGAVTAAKLGANAVTDAAVADGALSQDKINGLDTTLATKMTITNATSEAGKYVFTANVAEDGVTDYAWELIAREGEE